MSQDQQSIVVDEKLYLIDKTNDKNCFRDTKVIRVYEAVLPKNLTFPTMLGRILRQIMIDYSVAGENFKQLDLQVRNIKFRFTQFFKTNGSKRSCAQ